MPLQKIMHKMGTRCAPARVHAAADLHPRPDIKHREPQAAQHRGKEAVELHAVAAPAAHDNLVKQGVEVQRHDALLRVVQRKGLEGHARDLPRHELRHERERVGGVPLARVPDVREVALELLVRQGGSRSSSHCERL